MEMKHKLYIPLMCRSECQESSTGTEVCLCVTHVLRICVSFKKEGLSVMIWQCRFTTVQMSHPAEGRRQQESPHMLGGSTVPEPRMLAPNEYNTTLLK